MRSPSSRVLKQRIDIYVSSPGRDVDGGVQFNYPTTPTYPQVRATTQAQTYDEIDDQGRITMVVEWKILLGEFVVVSPRDMIKFNDPQGIQHTVFVEANRDNAGRGSTLGIRAIEKI